MTKKSVTYKGDPKPYGKKGFFNESNRHKLCALGIKNASKNGVGFTEGLLKNAKKIDPIYSNSTQPILSYPGGKTKLTKRLLKKMPPHKTYVEPFVGGASVFFSKPPAEKSVINDKDKEVMDFYNDFASIDVKAFNDLKFNPSKRKFNKVMNENPRSSTKKVYKKLLENKLTFMGQGGKYNEKLAERRKNPKLNIQKSTKEYKQRLKNAKKHNMSFEKVIEKYDSPDTFFYLDPPYPDSNLEYDHNDVSPKDVYKAVKDIKGKFMLSYSNTDEVKDTFKDFNVRRIKTRYSFGTGGGDGKPFYELLITNYDQK